MNAPATKQLDVDIALIGGGIAGLWLLNRLVNEGYNAILFEQEALGHGQTTASQGMIHGGIKYTLSGALSGSSEAIADMPEHWENCLQGRGDVNLLNTQVLSDHFYMWSTAGSLSKVTTFFASKALRGRVNTLSKANHPPLFQHKQFKGNLYELVDVVIDTPSLLRNLADNVSDRLFQIDWQQASLQQQQQKAYLEIQFGGQSLSINARQFIFSAGIGNQALLDAVNADKPSMQARPLQQVMVKHDHEHMLYAHCIGTDSTPRLTISSHRCHDGKVCWYLGGQLAENGVETSAESLINEAREELQTLFPWLDWQDAQWATLPVTRAEPKQKQLVRPDKAFIDRASANGKPIDNVLAAWPTKLTLTPNLGNETLDLLRSLNIHPTATDNETLQCLSALDKPVVAASPWDVHFP